MKSFTSALNDDETKKMRKKRDIVLFSCGDRFPNPILDSNKFWPDAFFNGFCSVLNGDSNFGRFGALLFGIEHIDIFHLDMVTLKIAFDLKVSCAL